MAICTNRTRCLLLMWTFFCYLQKHDTTITNKDISKNITALTWLFFADLVTYFKAEKFCDQ